MRPSFKWLSPPPEVAAQIEPAVHVALTRLAQMGYVARPGRTQSDLLADPSIMQDAYEAGRPAEDEACRIGDDRFFPREA